MQRRIRNGVEQIINPASGRWVNLLGKIGRKLACPDDKIRNPRSKRCVKRSGRVGKRVLREEDDYFEKEIESYRPRRKERLEKIPLTGPQIKQLKNLGLSSKVIEREAKLFEKREEAQVPPSKELKESFKKSGKSDLPRYLGKLPLSKKEIDGLIEHYTKYWDKFGSIKAVEKDLLGQVKKKGSNKKLANEIRSFIKSLPLTEPEDEDTIQRAIDQYTRQWKKFKNINAIKKDILTLYKFERKLPFDYMRGMF